MGRPNPVLDIVVWRPWLNHAAVRALIDAGHRVTAYGDTATTEDPDAILHPASHGWNDELWDDIDVALKAARKRRKERKA